MNWWKVLYYLLCPIIIGGYLITMPLSFIAFWGGKEFENSIWTWPLVQVASLDRCIYNKWRDQNI